MELENKIVLIKVQINFYDYLNTLEEVIEGDVFKPLSLLNVLLNKYI